MKKIVTWSPNGISKATKMTGSIQYRTEEVLWAGQTTFYSISPQKKRDGRDSSQSGACVGRAALGMVYIMDSGLLGL